MTDVKTFIFYIHKGLGYRLSNLQCIDGSVVLSSHIVSKTFKEVKVAEGHGTVPQVHVTGPLNRRTNKQNMFYLKERAEMKTSTL